MPVSWLGVVPIRGRRRCLTGGDAAAAGLRAVAAAAPHGFGTVLADPPWQFQNRAGEIAPEHRRLWCYGTMTLDDIKAPPVVELAAPVSHLYPWVPNALLTEGLAMITAWVFAYRSNIVWHKARENGGPDVVYPFEVTFMRFVDH